MVLATIESGAIHGSTLVTVVSDQSGEATVNLWRGTFHLGGGRLVNGKVTITVSALAEGDLIQASIGARGNQCGLPVQVLAADAEPTGWLIPDELTITHANGKTEVISRDTYVARYGVEPPAFYDPSVLQPFVAQDAESLPGGGTQEADPILFDVTVEQQTGKTVVTVKNVNGAHGLPLIRWGADEAYGNSFSRTFTQAATVTISVRGEDDAVASDKPVSFDVFSPPATPAPAASDIIALSYRFQRSGLCQFYVNSTKACECRLDGVDAAGTWAAMTFYGDDYQERLISSIPVGSFRFYVRVAGDTDSTHWRSFIYASR